MTSKLTPEEEAFVQQARKLAEQRAQQAPKPTITNPDKYSAPVGMTDEGELFGDDAGMRGFEEYTPTTTDIRSIWDTVRGRVQGGQAKRIAIVASDAALDVDGLKRLFVEQPIDGLAQLVVVRDSRVLARWP